MFKKSTEFVTIMKKLYWTCHPNITRFGYKRRMVELALPGLCDYYDNHFYTRDYQHLPCSRKLFCQV